MYRVPSVCVEGSEPERVLLSEQMLGVLERIGEDGRVGGEGGRVGGEESVENDEEESVCEG